MQAYGNRILPKDKTIVVMSDHSAQIGDTFEVLSTQEKVLNIACVTDCHYADLIMAKPSKQYAVTAVIIA